jgi:hypothetical protein
MTGFEPVHVPFWQVSVCVHRLLSLQAVPLVWLDHALVDALGVQSWQTLPGFTAPEA